MRILITGASGQLGLALQTELLAHEVVALGHDDLDVTDATAVRPAIAEARSDVVIHSAAWTDTTACEGNPERAMRENAGGAANVAEACADNGSAMVYVSTNEVFDGEKGAPYGEDDAPHAINEYGRSKLAGEVAVRETLADAYIVRTSWVYGPGRVSFPEKIIENAHKNGALKLVTDEIASPTWTRDLAAAIAKLIETRAYGTYHLAGAGECSRKEWAEEIVRLAGIEVPVEATTQTAFNLPFRKPVRSTLANNAAAKLGITLRPWQEALRDHMQETGALATGARA